VRLAGLAACVALAACGAPPVEKSDWERSHEAVLAPAEDALELPAYPREEDLVEFSAGPRGEFRFFVDSASISPGKDGVVRYTLVARSTSGAQNVSYEGMRCSTSELRVYAVGHGRDWVLSRGGWRPMQPGSAQRWHNALYREYFCPYRQPVASRRAALDALGRRATTDF
jgi:hypothetical protein